tara:strand:- start:1044 stop:1826 length:783 start_codon:yes stop_codon:yes gene_type:complete
MFKKKITNKDIFIFIICCFISIILFFSKDYHAIKKTRSHFLIFFSIIFSPKEIFSDLTELKAHNDSLIFQLKNILVENKNLKQRIRDAQDYYKYIEKSNNNNSFDLIPAKILNHSFYASSKILNLDVGLNDGVPKSYKAVINYDGNLIGRTYFISNKTTQVHKINDKNFHVFVKTKNNIKGQFSYKNGKRGVVESVSKKFQNQINIGDTIFTSFSSDIYPENIPVAEIISITNNPIKHELNIAVEILADLNRLRNVFIIK